MSKIKKHLKTHKTAYILAGGVTAGAVIGAVATLKYWKWEGRNRFLAVLPNEPGKYLIAGCKLIDGQVTHFASEFLDMAEDAVTELGTRVL